MEIMKVAFMKIRDFVSWEATIYISKLNICGHPFSE